MTPRVLVSMNLTLRPPWPSGMQLHDSHSAVTYRVVALALLATPERQAVDPAATPTRPSWRTQGQLAARLLLGLIAARPERIRSTSSANVIAVS
jgi:hypothetical protein